MVEAASYQLREASRTAMKNTPQALLSHWLEKRLPEEQWNWLQERLIAISQSNSDKNLYIALGMAPRKLGKLDLELSEDELSQAKLAVSDWNPADWSVDGTARILMLLTLATKNPDDFGQTLRSLCATADVSEAIVYYRGSALFPLSSELNDQIGEGLRTNMRAVFEAIAHNNPYPAKHFDDHRWNHMILKALFVDSRLHPIQGLDRRANPELAEILCHYAHERWAAGRPVTAELWRCVGPHSSESMLKDLARASQSEDSLEHRGAMLALSQSPLSGAAQHLSAYPITAQAIANGELTWDALTMEIETATMQEANTPS